MARVNHKARLVVLANSLSPSVAGHLADFLETMAVNAANEEIAEIDMSTRAGRRRAKAEAAAAETAAPARKRRAPKAEVEEAPPARRTRKPKAEVAEAAPAKVRTPRAPKAEPLEEDVTVDDLYDILDNFEGDPILGGLRELKPQAEAYGFDIEALLASAEEESGEKLSTKEKAEELGIAIAASIALEKQIVATLKIDESAMDDIIEDLELDISEKARAPAIAKAIVIALNDAGDDEDEEDADEGDEDEDEDEVEEVAPRRRRAKAEVEEVAPARKRRSAPEAEAPARKRRAKAEDDLSDLDDLDD
jgi:hypothetical protein